MKKSIGIALAVTVLASLWLAVTGGQTINNPHGDIQWDCQYCHSAEAWSKLKEPSEFNHDQTGFTLTGAHSNAACKNCHEDLTFSRVGAACADCHTDIHRNQFGIACSECHTPIDWSNRQDILRQHSQRGFTLVGLHAVVDCDACHLRQGREEFAGTPVDCEGCHFENYTSSDNPNHSAAGFSGDCQICHLPIAASWSAAVFEHTPTFALNGAHKRADCAACHTDTFHGTQTSCYDCHETDFQSSVDPAHAALGFPTDCRTCHTEIQWTGAEFDHLSASGFAIEGAHNIIGCVDCHVENRLDLPTDCMGCHIDDFNGTVNPNHVQSGFPDDCTLCHNNVAWSPSSFDHNQTAFPLTGNHAALLCESCHQNGRFDGTPSECIACHQNDYNSAADPDHAANNFNTDCTLCHSTSGWSPSLFNHSSTQFPLTGAHVSLSCISCHADGYDNTPTACFACHADDYNSVQDPNHVSNNFSTDCTVCHNTNGWTPVQFDHAQTQFPLTGAHVSLSCISCHADGYDNTPTACFACHADDFNGSSDPNHQAMGFPTNCEMCHTTSSWSSNWNHDSQYFPIFSGRHDQEWNNCADCHVIPGNYVAFECIFCHEHNQQDTDNDHDEVPDYQYNSQACYNCHPDGRGL